jgi:hypothetical protein
MPPQRQRVKPGVQELVEGFCIGYDHAAFNFRGDLNEAI